MTGRTSPTNEICDGQRGGARAGFTLLELTLALAILSLIAALALPRAMPVQSTTDLRVRAWQVTAVLRADRNAALRNGTAVTTVIDTASGRIRSGATGNDLMMPDSVALRFSGGAGGGIRFLPDGRSTGGLVVLARGAAGYGVRVNPATGAVDLTAVKP
jgi:general secretion pathway protein H